MNFVFQKEFNDQMDEYGKELEIICRELNVSFYPISIVPFEHNVVDDSLIQNLEYPTIAYGSNVMEGVVERYGWSPGWFHIPQGEVEAYTFFGEHYINSDMLVCNTDNYMQSLKDYGLYDLDFYFMKPNDQKYFPGTIVDKKMMPFVIESQGRHHMAPKTYDLCISPVKYIEAEWRFFVADGKIVDGSKYHAEEFRLDVQAGYEQGAYDFAEQMIQKYVSKRTFVIDIAKMKDGSHKVVEVNCLNSSGFYKIDKRKLISALKTLVDK